MNKLNNLINKLCPNGVRFVKLEELCPVMRGRRLTKSQLSDDGKYIVYHGSKDTPLGFYDDYNVEGDTVIVVNTGGIGGVKYNKESFWCSDGSFWIKHNDKINNKFLYYYLVQFEDYYLSQKRVGGVPTIDKSVVSNTYIPVPPLEIQEEIVRILDNFTELIEELSSELLARQKQFNYYRDEIIKNAPDAEYKTLEEISTDMYRGAGIKRDEVTSDGIPCVRYGEIYTTYNVTFDTCVSHTNEEKQKSKKYFEYGDVLFAITGESVEEIGKSIVYLGNDKCLAGGDIVVMKHKQNPKYIGYALSTTEAQLQKSKGKVKSKVVHSSVPSLKEISIPIPSLENQEQIANLIEKFDKICNDMISGIPGEIEKRKKQYEYYRNKLFKFKEWENEG